jgi:hypothetical protein
MCQKDGVKECCLLCQIWAYDVKSSATSSSKITNEFVGKLTRFPVLFVWHVFLTVYVFNDIIISHPFPGENVKGS